MKKNKHKFLLIGTGVFIIALNTFYLGIWYQCDGHPQRIQLFYKNEPSLKIFFKTPYSYCHFFDYMNKPLSENLNSDLESTEAKHDSQEYLDFVWNIQTQGYANSSYKGYYFPTVLFPYIFSQLGFIIIISALFFEQSDKIVKRIFPISMAFIISVIFVFFISRLLLDKITSSALFYFLLLIIFYISTNISMQMTNKTIKQKHEL